MRTPARIEEDLVATVPVELLGLDLPSYARVVGNKAFQAEELLARELGYRFRIGDRWSFDVALFDNEYDRLLTNERGAPVVIEQPAPHAILPARFDNGMRGDTYGGTFVVSWQALSSWRLRWQYSYLNMDLELKPGSTDRESFGLAGNSPEHQAALHSDLDLPRDLRLHTRVRYVGALPNLGVPSYVAADLSLAWRLPQAWSASLTARNLNDARHAEITGGSVVERSNLIERSLYLELRKRF